MVRFSDEDAKKTTQPATPSAKSASKDDDKRGPTLRGVGDSDRPPAKAPPVETKHDHCDLAMRTALQVGTLQSGLIEHMGAVARRLELGDTRMSGSEQAISDLRRDVTASVDKLRTDTAKSIGELSANIKSMTDLRWNLIVIFTGISAGVFLAFLAFRLFGAPAWADGPRRARAATIEEVNHDYPEQRSTGETGAYEQGARDDQDH